MVTLHLAGDIVTHPDHGVNYRRRQRKYGDSGKCVYGIECTKCETYVYKIKHTKQFKPQRVDTSICHMQKSIDCPKYQDIVFNANIEKTYGVTNSHYRKIADQAAYMKENSKHKLLFITLTFGDWKHGKEIPEKQANECFSKFMENLKENYGRGNYIAVRERSEKHSQRLHYHCIIELPFHNFSTLNNAWCNATSEYCDYSKNALTTDREARFIRSTVSAVKYICKYISKCRGQRSETRIIFTSRELSQAELKCDFSGNDFKEILREYKSIQVYKCNEFTWRYSISYPPKATKEQKERTIRAANAWYYQVVRGFFGYADRKRTELYMFPEEKSQK